MLMSQFFSLLLLGGFILISVPCEGVVYHVRPTASPSNDNLGETLDYYFSHGDRYFSTSKVKVTMILLHGKHTLSNSHSIKDLEMFEMIGMEPAHDVIVQLSATIELINITTIYIGTLTFTKAGPLSVLFLSEHSPISTNQGQLLSSSVDRAMYITINETLFKGIVFRNYFQNLANVNIVVEKSTCMNWSTFAFLSLVRLPVDTVYDMRQWRMSECTVSNSVFFLTYNYANVTIENSKFMNMLSNSIYQGKTVYTGIKLLYSTVVITGNVLISKVTNEPKSQLFLVHTFCNVTVTGNATIINNKQTPLFTYLSTITLCGNILFQNNTGFNGGAMALYSSTLNIASNTSAYFFNNTATETGGAIYVTRDKLKSAVSVISPCFYQLLDSDHEGNWYDIQFQSNSAKNGGDHIYGEYMHSDTCYVGKGYNPLYDEITQIPSYQMQHFFTYNSDVSLSKSPISSDPTRVCLCDDIGQPQCADLSKIYVSSINVHPGETFTLSAVVVGADFGTTVGTVHAIFTNPKSSVVLKPASQYIYGIINNRICSDLNYTVFSHNRNEVIYLSVTGESFTAFDKDRFREMITEGINFYHNHNGTVKKALLYASLILNVTLLPCPPGFTLLGDPPGCDCHPVLSMNKVNCQFINGKGHHSWKGPLWLNITNFTVYKIYLAKYCPFDYCNNSEKFVNFQDDADAQCLFNHAGNLCGGCKEGYSLAMGSSHCIHCLTNSNLTLLIFFLAAGLLLVFFIGVLNITVTQGMINGLIFYANIVWTYQSILFSQQVETNAALVSLRTFIAWLNLDFGIQVCFFRGLNAFWKTWLQYLFPLYIWSITGVIIVGARYSSRLTKLIGNRAVSVLATLFLLSYTKLLQIIISSIGFTPLKVFSNYETYTLTVWSLDGNYTYCHFPHILLFTAALFTFTFLWLPYTLLLFLMQWIQKQSHLKMLKWIPRLNPVYDAYFAPLKDKHHYWFGVQLVVRGGIIITFTLTKAVYPTINHLSLLMTASLLLCYANYYRVYKKKAVQLTENIFLLLLLLVGGSGILEENAKHVVVYVSVTIVFLTFCGLIIWNVLGKFCCKNRIVEREYDPNNRVQSQYQVSDNTQFRDSILDETLHHPLLETY